jgi:hypothetical protein
MNGDGPIQRFFVSAHGPDDDALADGFRWLFRFAQEHGCEKAAVFVPGVAQIESLGRVVGEEVARSLRKDREIVVDGVTVDLLIERRLPFAFEEGPVLAVWVDDRQLDKLDGLRSPGICAIPWVQTDIDGWKTNWNPVDVRTGEPEGSDETIGNPVVVKAMEALTNSVNLSTGLGHPSDKESAIQMLRLLKGAGEDYDPDQLRAWAVRHGWQPHHARSLAEIAEKINMGRRVQGGRRQMWRTDIIDLWREEAAESDL